MYVHTLPLLCVMTLCVMMSMHRLIVITQAIKANGQPISIKTYVFGWQKSRCRCRRRYCWYALFFSVEKSWCASNNFDAGRNGLGGRLRGAPFLRAADPRLAVVCSMLEREGLLQRWEGRFGVLGSSGGGFLPAQVVTSTSIGGMNKANEEEDENKPTVGGRSSASDAGDFCNFVDGSKTPTYVGIPSLTELCPNICQFAGIEAKRDARVVGAIPSEEGGWYLNVREGQETAGNTMMD